MITIGIDAGTSKWAVSVLEEKVKTKFVYELTIPTEEIVYGDGRKKIINLIKKIKPECVSLPSGYGLPLKDISELNDEDIFKISLKKDKNESIGIRKFLNEIRKEKFKGLIIPSVKLLPTVEDFKKINVIDMGTSDKLCSAVYALSLSKNFKRENFILAELGFGFNAFLKICDGKICDGIGGTLSSSGFLAHGKTDTELNLRINKFSGGVLSIINSKISPNIFFKNYTNIEKGVLAYNYFIEGVIKDISSLLDKKISKILLTGKNGRFVKEKIKNELKRRHNKNFVVKCIDKNIKGSSASRGGAILANGICNGKFKDMIAWMKIKEAKGDIFDYIFI